MDNVLEKPLPHNAEAERAILGSILLNNDLLDQAAHLLSVPDFYVAAHRHIFRAMLSLREEQRQLDPILVAQAIELEVGIASIGGLTFLTNLTYGLPHLSNVKEYVSLVKECAEARQLVQLCNQTIAEVMDDYRTYPKLEGRLAGITANREGADSPANINQSVDDTLALMEKWRTGEITAVPTGIPELEDALTNGGWYPQEITMIAARTSVGKTAFTLQASAMAARSGIPTLLFSLEMNREALIFRIASSLCGIATSEFSPKSFKYGRGGELFDAVRSLRDLPLFLGDKTRDITRIVSNSRHWVRHYGVKLITVDYIGLVQTHGTGRRFGNTVEKLGYVMDTFKDEVCGELNVPLLLPVQLNRVSLGEKRRPEAHDLKGSGDQEQTAHNVLIIYTPTGTTQDDENIRHVNLYCAKQRNGPRDWELPMDYDIKHQTFWTPKMRTLAETSQRKTELALEAADQRHWADG